jgi:hypothetical protein
MKFGDVVNPTIDELRAWATSGEPHPMQDWDVVLSVHEPGDDLLDLVEAGPEAQFFLRCLYIRAGDSVRTGRGETLSRLIDSAGARPHEWLRTWARRADMLVREPVSFSYAAWCDGGLATTPDGP